MTERTADIRNIVAAACSAAALSACAVPLAYEDWRETSARAYTINDIRQDPSAFLAAHAGERVEVEGYFLVDRLGDAVVEEPGGTLTCIPGHPDTGDLVMIPSLAMNPTLFDQALDHRVVIEARISPPRHLELGGGDLIVPFAATDMLLVLDDALLVAVDWAGAPCDPGLVRAP